MSKAYLTFGIVGYFVQASILLFIVWGLLFLVCTIVQSCNWPDEIMIVPGAALYMYAIWASSRLYKYHNLSGSTVGSAPSIRAIWFSTLAITVAAVVGFLYLPKFF